MLNQFIKNLPIGKFKKAKSPVKIPASFICLQEISKRYGEIVALSNVSCTILNGEFVSLVGPSGAGKSTLIRLLTREELPSAGHIYVAGRDITRLSRRELPYFRRKVGVVFQDFKLLARKTVAENVAFALEVCDASNELITERVPKIIELVSLDHRVGNYPHELSGGERQRVSIARALVHNPKILIADEPTGNLDPTTSVEIVQLLIKINQQGTTVILATHNKGIVDDLKKRVIVMRGGEIVADNPVGHYEI